MNLNGARLEDCAKLLAVLGQILPCGLFPSIEIKATM